MSTSVGVIIGEAHDPRPDAANVETAHARTEESIADADRILPLLIGLLQRMDIAALAMDGEYEALGKAEIFRRIHAGANIFDVPAQAREIFMEHDAMAAGRADAVGIVVGGGEADGGRQPLAEFLAEIPTRLERVALRRQRAITVRIEKESILVERDIVAGQRVARAEADIFGDAGSRA